ncbi:MAG: DUF2721 domain-containing protein [Desulfotalea sp.]
MEISLTTPAFLFPAATFLLIAYTNRFLALGSRIRILHDKYLSSPSDLVLQQIISLRRRVVLIKYMQGFGVFGLFLCVSCICALFTNYVDAGRYLFGGSLICFLASLAISLVEINLSVEALNIELTDIENMIKKRNTKD